MKKFFLSLLFLFAWAGAQSIQIQGQKTVSSQWFYFGTDSSRTIRLVNGQWFKDSANLGTTFKRIDNTVDSCSQPAMLATNTGGSYPLWLQKISAGIKSNVVDSNTFAFRVQVRDRIFKGGVWTAMDWYRYTMNSGYGDVTIQDSALFLNNKSTTKFRQYALYSALGDEIRICPEVVASTFKTATDTMTVDSIYSVTR